MLLLVLLLAVSSYAAMDLTYFDARGRAEQFRLFFADHQITYNDIRLTGPQFGQLQKTFPWGKVPVINTTQHPGYLADTAALNVYFGQMYNAWPTDILTEEILLDYSGASEDLRIAKIDILGTSTSPVDPGLQNQFAPILRDWLFYMERNLQTNGFASRGPYLLGDRFTPVDCRVWDVMDQIHSNMDRYPNIYDPYVLTQRFRASVASRPNIAYYLAHRK
jgi:glutathione S-transferase